MGLTKITSDGITDGTIATADLADQSVSLAKLPHGTSSNDGKFLRANNGADPTFETVNTDLSADSSPQLGGALDTNGKNINFGDSTGGSADDRLVMGNGQDMAIYHDPSIGNLVKISSGDFLIRHYDEEMIVAKPNDAVELYHDNSKKFETTSGGVSVTGTVTSSSHLISGGMVDISDNNQLRLGNSQDMMISHDGSSSGSIRNQTGELYLRSDGIRLVNNGNDETYIKCIDDGAVELYHNNTRKFQTDSNGVYVNSGSLYIDSDNEFIALGNANDFKIFHDGTLNRFQSNGLKSFQFNPKDTDVGLKIIGDGGVELYYDNTKMAETISTGFKVSRSGGVNLLVGSENAGGVTIALDGDSNGDGSGGDYATIEHDTTGNLHIRTDCPAHNCSMAFSTNGTLRHIIHADGHFYPYANNTYDLGMNSNRWRNIYTNDLNLSNEGSSNDVDGTWGSFTIQEGSEDLFLINKRSGKKYKFNLTEVA